MCAAPRFLWSAASCQLWLCAPIGCHHAACHMLLWRLAWPLPARARTYHATRLLVAAAVPHCCHLDKAHTDKATAPPSPSPTSARAIDHRHGISCAPVRQRRPDRNHPILTSRAVLPVTPRVTAALIAIIRSLNHASNLWLIKF
jgi:hypothetical protein